MRDVSSRENKAWALTRDLWFLVNRPDLGHGLYACHYCKRPMSKNEVTLDHKLQWSFWPERRYDISNLLPACYEDNQKRGSMEYVDFVKRHYPNLMNRRPVRPGLTIGRPQQA